MNTPFLLTITSGTELLSEHVHLNHQIFMKQLSPQQQFLLLRLFSPDSDTLCLEGSSHGSNVRSNARDALFWRKRTIASTLSAKSRFRGFS